MQLVLRYKKFRELLPKAEAELQQQLDSLDQTPVHERPQFVLQLKDALQSMARGERAVSAYPSFQLAGGSSSHINSVWGVRWDCGSSGILIAHSVGHADNVSLA